MSVLGENATAFYPRKLRAKERDLLEAVLPESRPGYKAYRDLLPEMDVIGEGRRGTGNLVLGRPGDRPDLSLPLGPVIAFGMVETTRDSFSVSVREQVVHQIDVDIVSSHGEAIPDHFEEKRRWTYSSWTPGTPSPQTGEIAREVRINENLVLGILMKERRLLLHERSSGMNHLIPVTNFYNELMLVRRIRDPKIALHSDLMFHDARTYGEDDLRRALIAYNTLKRRVSITDTPDFSKPGRGIPFLRKLFGKQ